jgi:hypothetical protein
VRSSIVATTLAAILTVASQPVLAQSRMKPTAPGTSGDPIWQGVVRLSDGRRLVTDGGIAIDAALAKLPKLPEKEFHVHRLPPPNPSASIGAFPHGR